MGSLAPIFCDECSVLALAQLDDRVLCADCLLAALAECPPDEIGRRIRPLERNEEIRMDD